MAKKVKSQAKRKEQIDKLLAKVPEESIFRCRDGRTFRDMKDLAEGLVAISDDTFSSHVNSERNDFSQWVRDAIKDEKLAGDLAKATSRTQAAGYVTARLAVLTGKGKLSHTTDGVKQAQPEGEDKMAQSAEQLSSSADGVTKAGPQHKAEAEKPTGPTPQMVKRVHELYEDLGREDVQALQEWEKAEQEIRKPEAKAEPQPEVKAELKPEAKAEPKPEAKAEPKPEAKHGMKGMSESDPKMEAKAEPQPEAKAEPQPEAKHGMKGMSEGEHHAMMITDFRRRFWVSIILTIPILALSPLVQRLLGLEGRISFPGDSYVLFALSSVIYFYGGWPFLKGIYSELKSKSPAMMTLISLAITTAYVYSSAVVFGVSGDVFFWELVTLIDVMLLGHWLEMRSIAAASSALEELARLMPSEAHKVMPDGSMKDVPLEELVTGDKVLVKPGEQVPADGVVVDGETSVNEAMLTGESAPVPKQVNGKVIGGSVNGEGSMIVEVKRTGADSYLAQVGELVRTAQESRSRTQNLANRAALVLTIVALGVGGLTLFVWVGLLGREFAFGLARMVTVLVIACPHALGLAIPLVVARSTSISAKAGLLIKDRDGFEQARKVSAILFDKTGTLTQGKFGVTDVVILNGNMSQGDMLKYAASVETNSEHPIAKGVVTSASETMPVEGFKSIPGKGAQGKVNGKEVMAVSPGYLREKNITINDGRIEQLASQGKTVIFVLIDGELIGAIALADIIRPESKQAISELKEMGISCMMITGDNKQVAKWVADEIGLDEYFAEVLPDKKAEKVKEVQSRKLKVAMTGDGVNDAPALAQADVGIAIGAGTDVAVATADIILVRSNPLDVVSMIKLSQATYNKMIQNLVWATGYNVIAIPLAAGVAYSVGIVLGPALGAAFMAASTIIVAINARFLRIEKRPQDQLRGQTDKLLAKVPVEPDGNDPRKQAVVK